ncbi:unnamed protein product, partial [marine sediment metagenome]
GTFDFWFRFSDSSHEVVTYYAYACDEFSNCVNSSFVTDILQADQNQPPNTPYLTAPLEHANISGTTNITWIDGLDPDLDYFNISIFLQNGSGFNWSLTSAVGNGTEYFEWDTTGYADGDYYNISIMACNGVIGCSGNDTSEGWFTIDNTKPTTFTMVTPSSNNSWTNHTYVAWNYSVVEVRPHTCFMNFWYDNATEITNQSGSIATGSPNYCSGNETGFAEGTYRFRGWMNDTSGNSNFSVFFYHRTFDL